MSNLMSRESVYIDPNTHREGLAHLGFKLISDMEAHVLNHFFKKSLVINVCCNKLPEISWLNTTQIYYLRVLEVRSWK